MTAFVTHTRVDPKERGVAGRSFSAQRRDPAISLRVAALPEASAAELAIHARLLEQERAFDARRLDPDPEPGAGAAPVPGDPVLRIVLPMRKRGSTLRDIASALNRAGLSSASGTAWRPTQVSRLLRDLV